MKFVRVIGFVLVFIVLLLMGYVNVSLVGVEVLLDIVFIFNLFFFLIGGFLVFWMVVGFVMFEVGFVCSKNVVMQFMKNMFFFVVVVMFYYFFGYNLMYLFG